jgi:hypothetical protein
MKELKKEGKKERSKEGKKEGKKERRKEGKKERKKEGRNHSDSSRAWIRRYAVPPTSYYHFAPSQTPGTLYISCIFRILLCLILIC